MTEKKEAAEPRHYKLKEVCVRLADGHPLYSDVPLSSPPAARDVMCRELSGYDREVLCVVNLNTRLKPINFNIVSVGELGQSIASIPNILKSGILSNAGSFLLLHNHPSGDVTPSADDILTTRKVIEAGKLTRPGPLRQGNRRQRLPGSQPGRSLTPSLRIRRKNSPLTNSRKPGEKRRPKDRSCDTEEAVKTASVHKICVNSAV